ncbi:MAG: hypothetical protein ONB44_03730 [candidate division KSB1 bacterium]|nr:hypothetical protein [candidate division KSB1 bacterium]MDZ7301239.1 hypothetical protein [candidate division KSB1 bacterium]MDZ7310537.1 hypothetical protein [candidate division KSB1 bacterium]
MHDVIDRLKEQPFNLSLFLLIIVLGMWIGSAIAKSRPWPIFTLYVTELMTGLFLGLLIGFALTFHFFTGILSIGTLTMGIVSIFNAPKEKKLARVLAVSVLLLSAILVYWLNWEDLGYLLDTIIEDFQ